MIPASPQREVPPEGERPVRVTRSGPAHRAPPTAVTRSASSGTPLRKTAEADDNEGHDAAFSEAAECCDASPSRGCARSVRNLAQTLVTVLLSVAMTLAAVHGGGPVPRGSVLIRPSSSISGYGFPVADSADDLEYAAQHLAARDLVAEVAARSRCEPCAACHSPTRHPRPVLALPSNEAAALLVATSLLDCPPEPECPVCPKPTDVCSNLVDARGRGRRGGGPPVALWPAPARMLPAPAPRPGRVYFITYGDERFQRSRARLVREAKQYPIFDVVIGYQRSDLGRAFETLNADLLTKKRGGGYWVWKGHIMYQTLLAAKDGDVVFYMDAGSTFRTDPTPLVELAARYGALTTHIGMPNHDWTKGALFRHMGMDMNVWGPQLQVASGLVLLRRSPQTLAFAKEWMMLSRNATLIDDSPVPGVPNWRGFKEHRHDQSILSLLVYKFGLSICLKGGSLVASGQIISHSRVEG